MPHLASVSVIRARVEHQAMINDVLMVAQTSRGCVFCKESEWNTFKEKKGECVCNEKDQWDVFKRAELGSGFHVGRLRLLSGVEVGLDHIPKDVTTQYKLDGIDWAFVVQEDSQRFFLRFPDHSDCLVPLEAFADNLTTITVISGQHKVDEFGVDVC